MLNMFFKKKNKEEEIDPETGKPIKTKETFVDSFVIAVVIALIIKGFIVQTYTIPSESMLNTLLKGDFIIVNRLSYSFSKPENKDIIVFEYPVDPSKDFIKRVVAVEGDKVRMTEKEVFLNGKKLDEKDYKIMLDNIPMNIRDNFKEFTVPKGHCFVMGDNRDNSYDSRFWGFVPYDKIKGKALLIYWSLKTPSHNSAWSKGILRTFRFLNPKYTRFDRVLKLIH